MWPFKKQEKLEFNGSKPTGYTFDMWKLQRYAKQPLFVCDQLMQTQRMHNMIEGSQFRGTAFTANPNWIMWKKKLGLGTFPIPMRVPMGDTPMGRVRGELYLVDSKRIKELDKYKLNGVEFRRKPVDLLVPARHLVRVVNADHNYEWQAVDRVVKLSAWMYVGRFKYWEEFLDAGYLFGRCQIHNPGKLIIPGSYYSFSELEYND
jgi:hypothetical protein